MLTTSVTAPSSPFPRQAKGAQGRAKLAAVERMGHSLVNISLVGFCNEYSLSRQRSPAYLYRRDGFADLIGHLIYVGFYFFSLSLVHIIVFLLLVFFRRAWFCLHVMVLYNA
jgi:hypothetical protein